MEVSVENRPQRYTAKDYKIAFRRSSIISRLLAEKISVASQKYREQC